MSRKPSWGRPGPAPLPRIHYAENAVDAYVQKMRRRTRRLFPVVTLLVVLRLRSYHKQRNHGCNCENPPDQRPAWTRPPQMLPAYCACCGCIKRYCNCTRCACGCGRNH